MGDTPISVSCDLKVGGEGYLPAWLSGYDYRKQIPADGTTEGTQTDYQMRRKVYKNYAEYGVDFDLDSIVRYGSNPILEKGAAASWEEFGVRDNSLLTDEFGNIVIEDGKHTLYYSGRNDAGQTCIGRATFVRSADKTTISSMTKYGSNPVLQPSDMGWSGSANDVQSCMVIKKGMSDYIMYFVGAENGNDLAIYYATSSDGLSWTPNTTPIVSIADKDLGMPCVRELQYGANAGRKVMFFEYFPGGSTYYYYSDVGWTSNWTDCGSNPVMEGTDISWGTTACNPKFIELADGDYIMGISALDGTDYNAGVAKSSNLTAWTDSGAIRLPKGSAAEWDDVRVESLEIVKDDLSSGLVGIFYFGLPTTDSFEDGAIGYATLEQTCLYLNGHCQDDFDDIRFTEEDGSTELDHWREIYVSGDYAIFWIELNSIAVSPGSTNFYIYYDNPGASSGSNGSNTFIAFDDFERGNDTDEVGGDWTETGGVAEISTTHAYQGTRAMKCYYSVAAGAVDIPVTASANIAIGFWIWKSDADNGRIFHGNGTRTLNLRFDFDEDIEYYDTAYNYIGDIVAGTWEFVELYDFDWTAYTHDIYHQGVLLQDDAAMWENTLLTDEVRLRGEVDGGGGVWYDDFRVRNWCDPEPTWAVCGAEESPYTTIARVFGRNRTMSPGLSLSTTISRVIAATKTIASGLTAALSIARSRNRTYAVSIGLSAFLTIINRIAGVINISCGLVVSTSATLVKGFSRTLASNATVATAVSTSRGWTKVMVASLKASVGMARYEYYITGENLGWAIYEPHWDAQTFTPSVAHGVTTVKLKLYKTGSPGTITVSIRATDGSGHPTGGDLCSGTTDGDTLPIGSPYEWRSVTFDSSYQLVQDTKYAIVVRALSSDSENYIRWRANCMVPEYSGGHMEWSDDSGSSWTSSAACDLMFEEWGGISSISRVVGFVRSSASWLTSISSFSIDWSAITGTLITIGTNLSVATSMAYQWAAKRTISPSLTLTAAISRTVTKTRTVSASITLAVSFLINEAVGRALKVITTVSHVFSIKTVASHVHKIITREGD